MHSAVCVRRPGLSSPSRRACEPKRDGFGDGSARGHAAPFLRRGQVRCVRMLAYAYVSFIVASFPALCVSHQHSFRLSAPPPPSGGRVARQVAKWGPGQTVARR